MLNAKRDCPDWLSRRQCGHHNRLAGVNRKGAAIGALRWSIALGVIAAATVPAVAQLRTGATAQEQTTFRVTSTAVQLVLRATDRNGRPVTNLRRSQIKILDNGRPGRIVAFRPAWEPHSPTAASGGAGEPGATSARAAGNAPRAVAGPPRYLGFVIDLSAPPYAIHRARLAIATFVRSGQALRRPLALFAVGSQALMLIPFTTERTAFLARLTRLQLHWAPWGGGEELRDLLHGLRNCVRQKQGIGMSMQQKRPLARNDCARARAELYTEQVLWHTNNLLSTLIALMRYLRGLPGPKTLVYLGPGFTFSPGRVATLAYESEVAPSSDLMLQLAPQQPHFRKLADAALHADVTLDGVDPRGLLNHKHSLGEGTRVKMFGPAGPMVAMEFWSAVNEGDHEGMVAAVAPTGGIAMVHSNDIAAEIAAAAGSEEGIYYASYVPADRRENGHFHRIKVVTRRQGVRIRTRMGYYAVRPKRLPVTFWAGKPGGGDAAPVCMVVPNRDLHWNGGGKHRSDLLSVWTRSVNASGAIVSSGLWAPRVSPGAGGYVHMTLRPPLPAGGSVVVHLSEVATGRSAELDAPAKEFRELRLAAGAVSPRSGSCGPVPRAAGR